MDSAFDVLNVGLEVGPTNEELMKIVKHNRMVGGMFDGPIEYHELNEIWPGTTGGQA